MTKIFRYFLFLVCAIQFFMAIACFLQWPFVTNTWPFQGTTPLTYIFISSIFAAAAASTLWVVVSGHYAALAGIGLDYITILTPTSILAFQQSSSSGDSKMLSFGIISVVGALFGLGLFLWSVRIPFTQTMPTPSPVRWSFIIFIVALLIVGGRLVLKSSNTIPWTITPELSVLMGWMFLGAATYFLYALLRPGWLNSVGQLVGFLAYDVVLIVPFLTRLPTTAPENQIGLIIYTIVVIYSGILAFYYLVPTRMSRVSA